MKYQKIIKTPLVYAFCHQNGTPVTRQHLSDVLKEIITSLSMNPNHYNTHSFRIGKATDLAENNYTHTQIAMIGRWKSYEFQKYLKLPNYILCHSH